MCEHLSTKDEKISALAEENIFNSISEIKKDSNLTELLETNQIKIVGAMYNIESGIVDFYD